MQRACSVLLIALAGHGIACSAGSDGGGDGDGSIGFDAHVRIDGGTTGDDAGDPGMDSGGGELDAGPILDGGPERTCVTEECGNGLDDDCDGTVDEGCACTPGETAPCFTGNPDNRARGMCRDGTMLCTGSFEFGEWGPCEGDVVADVEVCDAEGIDEDCDGAPNDGCDCAEGDPPIACGTSVGACVEGEQLCVEGRRTECEGSVGPITETCNGVDDDCDGTVDEAITRSCGSDVGVCRMGTETCTDGAWGACTGGTSPGEEVCDDLDNDCDGDTDESLSRACGSDVGACSAGAQSCSAGTWSTCSGAVGPESETCNDADDDCDGTVDEALTRSCGTDVGLCVAGTETCSAGSWGTCTGETAAGTELCDGTDDEDCDGAIDEGCGCTAGETRSCGTDTGECVSGTQTCDSSGAWGTCTGATGPATESCDGLDNDCDGTTDEGCDCITGETRSCGTDVGLCETGTETCDDTGRWGPCSGSTDPTTEVCNSADDDCDGMTDEGDVCPRFPPTVMCPGSESVTVGDTVSLSGSGSDPDGGSVTYSWSVSTSPTGSTAAPSPSGSATTSFTPDVEGDYTLQLCVTDDEGETACCTVTISASPACTPPPRPVLTTCPTSWDRRPIVEFDPLPAGLTYELFLDAATTPYATLTADGQNYHRPASELGTGSPPPGTTHEIYARACFDSDPSCCSVGDPVEVALVEECTTPVAPTSSNIVFSEYVINGDGRCPGGDCEAGEAIEITNLSHCPVALDGNHFGYCNPSSCSAFRWMDFGTTDVIPPRGVYVAIRNQSASMCTYPFFGPDDPGLFGLRISTLEMQGSSLSSGWFNNSGGGDSQLRIATGAWAGDMTGGTTLELVAPYSGAAGECESIGFDAIGRCGTISPLAEPTDVLSPNQLGRLWHPCDAVVSPVPSTCE